MYLDRQQVTTTHAAHSLMVVTQVTGKPDRIEIQLAAVGKSGDEAYGKVKLMLAKGYESQPLEQIEMKIARVLDIPRIKELVQARNKYQSVIDEISKLEASLSGGTDTERKVVDATKLIGLYQEEPSVAGHLNAVAFSPVQVPDASTKLEETKKTIAALQERLKQENIEAALKRYATAMDQVKAHCASLPDGNVNTRDELIVQTSRVSDVRLDLGSLETAQNAIRDLGWALHQSDVDYVTKCTEACAVLTHTLSQKEESIRADEVVRARVQEERRAAQERAEAAKMAEVARKQVILDRRSSLEEHINNLAVATLRSKVNYSNGTLEEGITEYSASSAVAGACKFRVTIRSASSWQSSSRGDWQSTRVTSCTFAPHGLADSSIKISKLGGHSESVSQLGGMWVNATTVWMLIVSDDKRVQCEEYSSENGESVHMTGMALVYSSEEDARSTALSLKALAHSSCSK
jgi:hypothetical protein